MTVFSSNFIPIPPETVQRIFAAFIFCQSSRSGHAFGKNTTGFRTLAFE